MEMQQKDNQLRQSTSRIWTGLFLLAVGLLLLAQRMGAPIPGWLLSWPMILIVIGIAIGIKSRFQNPGSFIMILLGSIFFLQQLEYINFKVYIIPLVLIVIGFSIIVTPKGRCGRKRNDRIKSSPDNAVENSALSTYDGFTADDSEYLEINAVLGGVKKRVLSKNFTGGAVVCFMGGAEINLLQADLQRPVTLDVSTVFGGAKILIPSNWDVKNKVTAILGGIDDQRNFTEILPDRNKVLTLTGSCVFGGIEISNF